MKNLRILVAAAALAIPGASFAGSMAAPEPEVIVEPVAPMSGGLGTTAIAIAAGLAVLALAASSSSSSDSD